MIAALAVLTVLAGTGVAVARSDDSPRLMPPVPGARAVKTDARPAGRWTGWLEREPELEDPGGPVVAAEECATAAGKAPNAGITAAT